jgi:flavodoxin
MTKPNLFHFATSELSQDAFIAWLLVWANNEYADIDKNLHACAVDFVRELLNKEDYNVETVKVQRQWNHTDVTAEVNGEFFILIEDKTGTSDRKNQLKRYLELAENYCKDKNMIVVPIYFKMEEQSDLSQVIKAGYAIFTREKMLSVLHSHESITNNILCDYRENLEQLNDKINGFKTDHIDKWGWYQWTGFFSTIQKEFDGNWDYVANPSGGFIGFWWRWIHKTLDEKGFHIYLQLEANKFVFKVKVDEHRKNCDRLREYCRKPLFEIAKQQNIKLEKYGKAGAYMGIAKLADDYRIPTANGLIDLPATIANLKTMQQLIDAVAAKL